MRRERKLQNFTIVILSMAILAMSIGFAVYEQKLNKNTSASLVNITNSYKQTKWDVRFDNTTFQEIGNIKATRNDIGNNIINFIVDLPKGDSIYSFTIDSKNYGSMDAKLTGISFSGLTNEQKKNIKCVANYEGINYVDTHNRLNVPLLVGENSKITVYVKAEGLEEVETINLTLALDYTSI